MEQFREAMVDLLQMRDWPRPCTVGARVKVSVYLIRVALAQSMKRALQEWPEAFGEAAE